MSSYYVYKVTAKVCCISSGLCGSFLSQSVAAYGSSLILSLVVASFLTLVYTINRRVSDAERGQRTCDVSATTLRILTDVWLLCFQIQTNLTKFEKKEMSISRRFSDFHSLQRNVRLP